MSITIQQCPECRTNKDEASYDLWEGLAGPNCLMCKGSGFVEKDPEKRWKNDRELEKILDKIDIMEEAGIYWEVVSEDELQQWRKNDRD